MQIKRPAHILNALYHYSTIIFLFSLLVFGCGSSAGIEPDLTQVSSNNTIQFSTCQLKVPKSQVSIPAKCATMQVFEDRRAQTGKKIDLNIAVIPAVSRNPFPDPVFFLAGGPGEAATSSFPVLLGAFQSIYSTRDIVLVDQRGTGQSNPLDCNLDDSSNDEQNAQELVEQCLQNLPGDPQFYTTSIAMEDLDQVREALGYEKINLVGVSYGTRAALFYARQHPDRVRTIVLDGVLPAQLAIGQNVGKDAQRALDLIFERCLSDSDCQATFPNIKFEFNELLSNLRKSPVKVSIPDPKTAKLTEMTLTAEHVASTVHKISYLPETAALIPLIIHSAFVENNYVPLAGQYLIQSDITDEDISSGMYLAVTCAEDAAYLNPETAEPGYMGQSQIVELKESCSVWPEVNVDKNIKDPVDLDIPVLLISGEADPITPPANAELAAETLPNSLVINLPDHGHVNLIRGCMPDLMEKFINQGNINRLSLDCLQNLPVQPFFLNFNGPTHR